MKLTLDVRYPDDYPDALPELSIEAVEGEVDDGEIEHLLNELRSVVCVSYMPQKKIRQSQTILMLLFFRINAASKARLGVI